MTYPKSRLDPDAGAALAVSLPWKLLRVISEATYTVASDEYCRRKDHLLEAMRNVEYARVILSQAWTANELTSPPVKVFNKADFADVVDIREAV